MGRLLAHVVCALPLCWLLFAVARTASGDVTLLGPDPGKVIVDFTGTWAIRVLLAGLSVTPLRRIAGWTRLARFRRLIGLWAFAYVLLHLLAYVTFLLGWHWSELAVDFVERPYITAGLLAFMLLLPLAATSTDALMRRLGRRWRQLHRLVYAVGLLGVVHVTWQSRGDTVDAWTYAGVLALLLLLRFEPVTRSLAQARLGAAKKIFARG